MSELSKAQGKKKSLEEVIEEMQDRISVLETTVTTQNNRLLAIQTTADLALEYINLHKGQA